MSVAQQAVRGTLAVAVATVVTRLVSLAGTLYLMAMIRPAEFGIVAYAVALLAICGAVSNWGFSQAAIHREERVDETLSTLLVLRLVMLVAVLGVLAAVLVPLRSVVLARTTFGVLAVLGGAALVEAGCDAPAARLTRSMRFGRLMTVEVITVVAATAVGVTMAALDFGIWALVGSRVAAAVVRAVGLGVASVEPTRLSFHPQDALWLLRFGFPLLIGGVATNWVLHYDDLVVGRMRGESTLGLYDRAYSLALLPLSFITGVLTRVSFPLYARLQSDRERLSEAFRIASGTTLRLAAPMAVGMALALPDFLVVMRWPQWRPMVPMFRWLLVYVIVRPLMDDAGGLLTAVGRPKTSGHTLLAEAAALSVLCPLLTWRWGAEGAAVSVGLVALCGLGAWYLWFLPRFISVPYCRLLLWPLLSVGAGAGAALAANAVAGLPEGLAGGAVKLAALGVVYAGLMLALDGRGIVADLGTLRRQARGK